MPTIFNQWKKIKSYQKHEARQKVENKIQIHLKTIFTPLFFLRG